MYNKIVKNFYYGFVQTLLIVLFPLIHHTQKSIGYAIGWEALILWSGIICSALIFYIICFFIFKSYEKASIFSSVFWIVFFILVPLSEKLTGNGIWGITVPRARYILIFMAAFLLVVFFRLYKSHSRKYFFSRALIIPFLVINGYNMGLFIFYKVEARNIINNLCFDQVVPDFGISDVYMDDENDNQKKLKPDIYYIVLDRYTSNNALQDYLSYNNSSFLKELRLRGFFIPSRSYSNYSSTLLSMASSLNMNYLDLDIVKSAKTQCSVVQHLINNSLIFKFLKSKGYGCFKIPADIGFLASAGLENKVYLYNTFGHYTRIFLSQTLFAFGGSLNPSLLVDFYDQYRRNCIQFQLQKLKKMPKEKSPFFVYAHILCPHDPFVFDEEGCPVSSYCNVEEKKAYVKQVRFINREILFVIDEIFRQSTTLPVIVLQGDHGFGRGDDCEELFSILNVFFLPKDGKKCLYESITPVNTFRTIFNFYLGSNFEILKDKSIYGCTKIIR